MTIEVTGVDQGELVAFLKANRNRVLAKPTLAIGTTTSRIQVTNSLVDFMIDGVIYRKAAEDNISVGSLTALTAGQTCRIRVEINSAGTVSFVQGPIKTGSRGTGQTPLRTASRATLGYIDVAGAFTFGTTAFTSETFTDGDPDLAPATTSEKAVGLEA